MEEPKFQPQFPSQGLGAPVPPKKPFIVKIIAGLIVLIIFGVGIALYTRAWDPLWNPFRPEPEKVIDQMGKKMEEVKTLHSETKIDFVTKEDTKETFKMSITFVSDSDNTDSQNPKSAGDFIITFAIEGMQFSLTGENKTIGKDSYLKLTTIPALPFLEPFLKMAGIDLSQIKDQWIKFDEESSKSLLNLLGMPITPEMEEEMRKSEEEQREMIEKFQAILKNKKLYIVKKEFPDTKIKNQKVYHYLAALNKEEIKKLIPELLKTLIEMQVFPQPPSEAEWQEFEREFPKEFDKFFQKIGDIEGEIFIGKKDLHLYKIKGEKEIDLAKIDPAAKGKIIVKVDVDFSNFGKPIKIEAPKEYKTLEEIFPKKPLEPLQPVGFVEYYNKEYGYRISYPKDWEREVKKVDDPKILHLVAFNPSPPSFTSFSVRVDLFPLEEQLEIYGGEIKEITLNQRKGYEITFPAEPSIKFWIFPYKGKNYSLSCLSPYDPNICDQIIKTFIIE